MFKKTILTLMPLLSFSCLAGHVELYNADGSPESEACIIAAKQGYTDDRKIRCNGVMIEEFAKKMHIKINRNLSKEAKHATLINEEEHPKAAKV